MLDLASNRVTTIPAPRAGAISGKLSTLLHVAAPSVLFQRPAWRVPRYNTFPLWGSTDIRSPLPRPSSLPPNLTGRLARWKVLPRSFDRRIAPSGVRALV